MTSWYAITRIKSWVVDDLQEDRVKEVQSEVRTRREHDNPQENCVKEVQSELCRRREHDNPQEDRVKEF